MCMYICGHLPSTLEPFLQSYVFDRLSFMNAHVLSLFTTVCHTYIALLYLKTSHHMEGIYIHLRRSYKTTSWVISKQKLYGQSKLRHKFLLQSNLNFSYVCKFFVCVWDVLRSSLLTRVSSVLTVVKETVNIMYLCLECDTFMKDSAQVSTCSGREPLMVIF